MSRKKKDGCVTGPTIKEGRVGQTRGTIILPSPANAQARGKPSIEYYCLNAEALAEKSKEGFIIDSDECLKIVRDTSVTIEITGDLRAIDGTTQRYDCWRRRADKSRCPRMFLLKGLQSDLASRSHSVDGHETIASGRIYVQAPAGLDYHRRATTNGTSFHNTVINLNDRFF